jgi:hypothetical protein
VTEGLVGEHMRRIPQPRWCPAGLTKTQWRRLQKMRKSEMEREKACDEWFNQARPMIAPKKTWREKRLAHEECSDSENTSQEDSAINENMKINMVFELPSEFRAPEIEVAEFALGAKVASFEELDKLGQHMKHLFVKGYVEGRPVQRIMVAGSARVNVMPVAMLEKMGFHESELMHTNTSLSAFTGEVIETKGVMSV